MAQQLERNGQEVGLAILLDPSPPHRGNDVGDNLRDAYIPRLSRSESSRLFVRDRLKLYRSELTDLPWSEHLSYVRSKLKLAKEIGRTGGLNQGNPTQLYRDAVFRANKLAGLSYTAATYDGPVAIFWSRDRDAESIHHAGHDDWISLLGNKLMVAEVPGSDSGKMLLPPNVEIVVEKIAVALRLAQGG